MASLELKFRQFVTLLTSGAGFEIDFEEPDEEQGQVLEELRTVFMNGAHALYMLSQAGRTIEDFAPELLVYMQGFNDMVTEGDDHDKARANINDVYAPERHPISLENELSQYIEFHDSLARDRRNRGEESPSDVKLLERAFFTGAAIVSTLYAQERLGLRDIFKQLKEMGNRIAKEGATIVATVRDDSGAVISREVEFPGKDPRPLAPVALLCDNRSPKP